MTPTIRTIRIFKAALLPRSLYLVLLILGFGNLASTAHAVLLDIANAGFENPPVGESIFTNNSIPDWTGTGISTNDYGVFNPTAVSFPAGAPEGFNVAYIQDGAIFQTLTSSLAQGDYSLTVQVGLSAVDPMSPFTVQLRAGATVLAQAASPSPAAGTFTLVTANYAATLSDPYLGQPLSIRLIENTAGHATEICFDDVRLDFTPIPEPVSVTLFLVGAVSFLLWRRGKY